jgi:hypothetical protein
LTFADELLKTLHRKSSRQAVRFGGNRVFTGG